MHELLHVEGRARIHHGAAGGYRQHGKRIGLAAHEVARALHRIDGDVGLEGRAWAAEPLAPLWLRRLAPRGLADYHQGVDIDLGKGAAHGVERGAAGVLAVAAPDPVEGGAGGPLGDAAEGKDKRRIDRTRGVHDSSFVAVPARDEQGHVLGSTKTAQRLGALYLMGRSPPPFQGVRAHELRYRFNAL